VSWLRNLQLGPQFLVGNRRLFLLCLLLFLVSGVLSFWFFFPAEVVQRYLVQEVSRQTGLQLQGRNAEMLFPFGLELDIEVESGRSELAPIRLQDLQLTPAWTRILSGTSAVDLQGELEGGTIEAEAVSDGPLELVIADVEIYALQRPELPYRLAGKLSGRLQAQEPASGLAGQGSFQLRLSETYLHGLTRVGLPESFGLGVLQLDGKFNQQRLSIEKVVMTEGAIEMSGGGTLLVAETPEQTRINLNLRLHPTLNTPDSVRQLLSLTGVKPTTDGSYLFRIAGTLAKPVLR